MTKAVALQGSSQREFLGTQERLHQLGAMFGQSPASTTHQLVLNLRHRLGLSLRRPNQPAGAGDRLIKQSPAQSLVRSCDQHPRRLQLLVAQDRKSVV